MKNGGGGSINSSKLELAVCGNLIARAQSLQDFPLKESISILCWEMKQKLCFYDFLDIL